MKRLKDAGYTWKLSFLLLLVDSRFQLLQSADVNSHTGLRSDVPGMLFHVETASWISLGLKYPS